MKSKLLSTIMLFIGVVFLSTTLIHAQEQTRAKIETFNAHTAATGRVCDLEKRQFSG
jgi:hypothetical protein